VHAVLRARGVSAADVVARLEAAGVAVTHCDVVEPSLEDVFLDVAQRSAA
jgi:hypothetical protein